MTSCIYIYDRSACQCTRACTASAAGAGRPGCGARVDRSRIDRRQGAAASAPATAPAATPLRATHSLRIISCSRLAHRAAENATNLPAGARSARLAPTRPVADHSSVGLTIVVSRPLAPPASTTRRAGAAGAAAGALPPSPAPTPAKSCDTSAQGARASTASTSTAPRAYRTSTSRTKRRSASSLAAASAGTPSRSSTSNSAASAK